MSDIKRVKQQSGKDIFARFIPDYEPLNQSVQFSSHDAGETAASAVQDILGGFSKKVGSQLAGVVRSSARRSAAK